MSTQTEMHMQGGEHHHHEHHVKEHQKEGLQNGGSGSPNGPSDGQTHAGQPGSQQHPLHQYDLSIMSKFYESCIGKMAEQQPKFKPSEWMHSQPMPAHIPIEQKHEWSNPMVISDKQKVYECFARLARETGEPLVLMPNFDFSDVLNFEKFLESLKLDGVNAIGKYKQYLNGRDIRKLEVDLVALHPRYGIVLVDVKESDHFDSKRRSRARAQLNEARIAFESIARLILESKGLKPSECYLPVSLHVALPNVSELPAQANRQQQQQQPTDAQNTSTTSVGSSTSSTGRSSRQLNYAIKSDLEDQKEFERWWQRTVVEPKQAEEEQRRQIQQQKDGQQQQQPQEEKLKKPELINLMLGLINCIRKNSILPVVYPESGTEHAPLCPGETPEGQKQEQSTSSTDEQQLKHLNQPALNVYAEFFRPEHEKARSLSKVVVMSRDSEKIRKTICLQTLWLLLNDSQKKISVVCSEMNKPYYEEFFARQRKVYNNLNNVRFYVDLHSCDSSQHTIKRDGEIWFFDQGINGSLADIVSRAKDLNSFWIFTEQEEKVREMNDELNSLNTKRVHLDGDNQQEMTRIKLPLRLQCDLLIIGDLIGLSQLKYLYKLLKNTSVPNQSSMYQNGGNGGHHQHHQQQQQYTQLKFNPSKKFRQIKFIRGGTIDNLRTSLKMHDSINAPVIFMHVGDEDLFKTRNSVAAIERVKELTTLVKEYCPKSFVTLSTLMRRQSRTENSATSEVNKGVIQFCRSSRDTLNCHYMLNNHFEPDYHTQGGRLLTPKGLRLFADNILFVVDHFLIRNNKQH